MAEIIINALTALAIYGGLVVIYTLLGAYNNINIWSGRWDWKIYLNGLAKYAVLGLSVLGTFVGAYSLLKLAPSWGVEVANIEAVGTKVLFGIVVAASVAMLAKIGQKLTAIFGLSKEMVEAIQKQAVQTAPTEAVSIEVADLPKAPRDYIERKKALEAEGGRGAVYNVPVGSYDAFRAAVIGRGFDIDGAYGAQCWDGAALLWQQMGRTLSTGGTGAARGCWEAARAVNVGSEFELVHDKTQIRRGDILVFGGSRWGHIGFADHAYNGSGFIAVLGQNQTSGGNGAPFNVANISLGNFLGAFRLRRWNAAPAPAPKPANPAPKPAPAPAPAVVVPATVPNNPAPNDEIRVGDIVRAWGVGTGDSYGGGGRTIEFSERPMKVIGINNGRYALNQYGQGTPGNVADATGWFERHQLRK